MLGLGNVILTDDGLGVYAVRRLRARHALAPGVEVVEGGTAGLLLLPWLADSRRAIVVDALDRGAAPGSLHRLDGVAWTPALDARMSPHDAGLADLLGAARVSGNLPDDVVLLGLQPARIGWGTTLSPAVAAALDGLVDAVAAQLAAWGYAVRPHAAGPAPQPTRDVGAGRDPAVAAGSSSSPATRPERM